MPRRKSDKDTTVPEILQNPVNYKILLIMIIGFIGFQMFLDRIGSTESIDIAVEALSIASSSLAGILSFQLAFGKYKNTKIGRNFFIFSLAFIFTALGEITFAIYDEMGLDPFPSIADIFFVMYYPFLFLFIHQHYKIFPAEKQNKIKNILFACAIVSTITLLFFVQLINTNSNFSDYSTVYGYVVEALDVIMFGLVLKVVFHHKAGMLKSPWVLLLYGILSITIADAWYYYTEILEQYELAHPLNLFYYCGYLLVIYATIKHRQII